MNARPSLTIAAALATGLLPATGAAAAPAPHAAPGAHPAWTSLGTSGQLDISDLIGMARSSDGTLHVAWTTLRSDSQTYDLMQTPVSALGSVGAPTPIVTGWSVLQGPSLVSTGDQLAAFFSGVQSETAGDPTDGIDVATSTDNGVSWSHQGGAIASGNYADARDTSVAAGPSGPLSAWYDVDTTVVHAGATPDSPPNQTAYGEGANQAVAADADSAYVGWCSDSSKAGVFVQQINVQTGAPAGSAELVPGSLSGSQVFCPASARVQLVAHGSQFFVATVTGDREGVRGWNVGSGQSKSLAGGGGVKQFVAAATTPGAKHTVWVGWYDGSAIKLRRSNPSATVFGATVTIPRPTDGSLYDLDLNAQADRVDVVARVEQDNGTVTLESAQQYPGLTLVAHSGVHPTFQVLDAGQPVPDASVTAGGVKGTTDGSGRVTFTHPPRPGHYKAQATRPKYVGASASVTVVPPPPPPHHHHGG